MNRNKLGQFTSNSKRTHRHKTQRKNDTCIKIDHNYVGGHMCSGISCKSPDCLTPVLAKLKGVDFDGWREGRRIVEWLVLLENLKFCHSCKLGPVPLTLYNVVGERQRGLGGYLYVVCQNPSCMAVNRVAYGKTHHQKKKGMPCFVVNTKLGMSEYLFCYLRLIRVILHH